MKTLLLRILMKIASKELIALIAMTAMFIVMVGCSSSSACPAYEGVHNNHPLYINQGK